MKNNKTNKKFPLFDKIILAANILLAVALLSSYLAPSTDPRDFTFIALLGFGYLILLAINLVFVVYWIFRKPILMLLSVCCIVLGFVFVKDQFGFNGKNKISSKLHPSDIRIMQYNVREFSGIDRFYEAPIWKDVSNVIDYVQPDIVNLQEYQKSKFNGDSIENKIKGVLKTKYFYFQPFQATRTDTTGNAIFSKFPIVSSGTVNAKDRLNVKAIYVDIKRNDGIIRIYCIHLQAVKIDKQSKRKLLNGNSLNNSSMVVGKLSGAFVTRSYQVDQIKRHMADCPYPYILTGDFNDTPLSFAVNELGDGLKNAFVEKGSGFQTTYYSGWPLQIDYIFTSRQFDILSYQAIDKKLSDHKPLVSDIRLK